MLELIAARNDGEVTIVGFEPVPGMAEQAVERAVNAVSIVTKPELLKGPFNKVACMQTCEHLPPKELIELFLK